MHTYTLIYILIFVIILTGFAVSKTLMLDYHYEVKNKYYGKSSSFMNTDTGM